MQQIYDGAGAPGARAFRDSARRAGIDISAAESKAFVAQQSSRQVFKQRIASNGKLASGGREDMRWHMDLIDYSKTIAQLKGHRYVLIAVDNYSWQVFTKAMNTNSSNGTMAKFRSMIADTDNVVPNETTTNRMVSYY